MRFLFMTVFALSHRSYCRSVSEIHTSFNNVECLIMWKSKSTLTKQNSETNPVVLLFIDFSLKCLKDTV